LRVPASLSPSLAREGPTACSGNLLSRASNLDCHLSPPTASATSTAVSPHPPRAKDQLPTQFPQVQPPVKEFRSRLRQTLAELPLREQFGRRLCPLRAAAADVPHRSAIDAALAQGQGHRRQAVDCSPKNRQEANEEDDCVEYRCSGAQQAP
jgi:hypothetical protein